MWINLRCLEDGKIGRIIECEELGEGRSFGCLPDFWLGQVGEHRLLLFSCQVVSNSHVTQWTITRQAPGSIEFPRQEYWSGQLAISFSRVSSRPRDWTWVSCIGRWVLYHWATREAPAEHRCHSTKETFLQMGLVYSIGLKILFGFLDLAIPIKHSGGDICIDRNRREVID